MKQTAADMMMMGNADLRGTPPDLSQPPPPDLLVSPDLIDNADLKPPPDLQDPLTVLVGPGGSMSFSPDSLTINVGDTVTWYWSGGGHNVVSGAGRKADDVFCSPNDTTPCKNAPTSVAGSKYTHTFNSKGTFPYFCVPHFGMTASITVK